mgnify:CR=1 FL=1
MNTANEQSLKEWCRSQAQIRLGRDYINEMFVAKKTALVVVDMQNYFMKSGFLAACPMAIEIVPAINMLADHLRSRGGLVVWVQTTADPEATKDWGVYKELYTPENWQRRNVELAEDHQGYAIWPELTVLDKDLRVKKSRFSAFISGSSEKPLFIDSKKKLLIIKSGDHSLSDKNHLKKIINELKKIVENIV